MIIASRRGFTLLEMSIVLAVMAVAATVVVPAMVDMGRTPQRRTADGLLSLLHAARKAAIERNVSVSVVIDPVTGKYRVDSTGVFGAGEMGEGQLDFTMSETVSTTLSRLQYTFRSTGAAMGDTVRVRGVDSSLVVSVDPWSGVASANATH